MNPILSRTEGFMFLLVRNKTVRTGFNARHSGRAPRCLHLMTGLYLFLITLHAHAATQAQQYFDQAMNAYHRGDYSLALDGFNSAIASGMDAPAAYYNLAVCYYRTGAYAEAEKNFLITARFPAMQAVAYYNLGLVSLKQEDPASAVSWLNKSRAASDDEKLDYLVSAALAEIAGADANSHRTDGDPVPEWSGVVFAGIGYDDNVTLDNSDLVLVSRQSAAVAELFANTQGLLSGSQHDGLLFKSSFYADMNDGHNEINIAELEGGFYLANRVGRWQNEYGLNLGHSTLGGDAYLDKAGLEWSAASRLSGHFRLDTRLRLRYFRSRDVLYDPLEGNSQDIRVAGKWSPDKVQDFKLYYQLYNNDRNDFSTATRYSSYSNTRHRIRAEYKFRFMPSCEIRFATEYRLSNYKGDNVEASGEVIRRQDDRIKLLLGLGYNWSRVIQLGVKYEYTSNDSNIARFDYVSNRVLASWTALY
jgi:tetratricopeptide (TPR) repeat protein